MGYYLCDKMKYIPIFFTLFMVAIAQGQYTCDFCQEGIGIIGEYLQTENELASVEQGLVDLVCQTLPEEEIQSCTELILENWRGMAPAMFASDSEIPTDICIGLGFCEPFLDRMPMLKDISCDECQFGLGELSNLLSDLNFAKMINQKLAGPAYCYSSYNVDGNFMRCKIWMEFIGVPIVQALGTMLQLSADSIC